MFLRHHGAHCCGVKTLEGFWSAPESILSSLPEYKFPLNHPALGWVRSSEGEAYDKNGTYLFSTDRFYWEECPEETGEERLVRYLDFLDEKRPSGMVEAYLNDEQAVDWHETLLNHGFKAVNRWLNSNTGYYTTSYQRTYGQPKKAEPAPYEKKTVKEKAPVTLPPFATTL